MAGGSPKKKRLTKKQKAELAEQEEIEADRLRLAEQREQMLRGVEHSNLIAGLMKEAGRMVDKQGLVCGENQTTTYADASCAGCGRHWAEMCLCTGRAHSEDACSPAGSPWANRSVPAALQEQSPTAKRNSVRVSRRRSKSPRKSF